MWHLLREFSRYTLASALGLLVDAGTLFLLTEWTGLHYLAGATIGFSLGAVTVYVLSTQWAFSHRKIADRRHEFAVFVAIGVAGLAINNLVMWSFTEWLGLHYMASKAFSTGGVFLFNFLMRRKFLFTPPAGPGPAMETESGRRLDPVLGVGEQGP